jgi:hypothetical protein
MGHLNRPIHDYERKIISSVLPCISPEVAKIISLIGTDMTAALAVETSFMDIMGSAVRFILG